MAGLRRQAGPAPLTPTGVDSLIAMTSAAPRSPRLLGAADVRRLADRLDLRPTKQKGQNFVIDGNTVRRIVRESGVTGDDVVLEVGPGLGSLTLALLEVAQRVVAIEIDDRLASLLGRDDRRARARPGRALRAGARRRAARHRGARPAADGAGGQPALQRLGAGAAAPDGAAAAPAARAGDGAGRGRRPAGGAAGPQDLRRPVGQGRLVRRRPARRVDRPQRLLARAQRRLGPGRLDPPRPADDHRHARAGVRRRRRRVRPPPQGAARVPCARSPRATASTPPSPHAGVDPLARGESLDVEPFARIAEGLQ